MKLSKKAILSIAAVILVIAAAAVYELAKGSKGPSLTFVEAKKGDITDEVDVSGTVKAAQDVDLAFERSGKIAVANLKIGDQVKSGQIIASLVSTDLYAQLNQAVAAYDMQSANLANLKNGASPDDKQLSQTQVDNASKSLSDAQDKTANDLNVIYGKTSDMLNDVYAKTFDAVYNKTNGIYGSAFSDPISLLLLISNQQMEDQIKNDIPIINKELSDMKNDINIAGADQSGIDSAIASSLEHLKNTRDFLTYLNNALNYAVPSADTPESLILTDKSNLNAGLAEVNAGIAEINGQQNTIATQKITNQSLLTQTSNALLSAQNALKLKLAGATKEQIAAQQAAVDQSKASVQNYQAQLAKSSIVSPIDGVISRQDAKAGEIATANVTTVSVISNGKFQVDAYVPESNIEKIKIGESARVTLDADNNQKTFEAKVISSDPGQTVIKGSPAYKVTLEFAVNDSLIKDGLSANVGIIISKKSGVISIPTSAIIKQGDNNTVLVDSGFGKLVQKTVTVGINENGLTEIISGLDEGARVAAFGSNQ